MLTIIAHITANETQLDIAKKAMVAMIEPTLQEKGCVRYELHQDNEKPTHFTFIEMWETHELWQEHMNGATIAAFKEQSGGALAGMAVSQMTEIA